MTPITEHTDSVGEIPAVAESRITSPSFHASTRYTAYVLFVLALANFFNSLDRALWSVLAIPIKAELRLTDTELGLLGGFAFALFYATMGLPIARIADKHRRATILSIAAGLWSAATVACGLVYSFATMFLARVSVGVGEAGCLPPSHSMLSDYFPKERRAFALGLFEAGGGLGIMIGLALAGVLADQIGWRNAFVFLGAPGIILALLVRLTVREPPRGRFEAHVPRRSDRDQSVTALLGRRTYRQIVLAFSLGVFGYYGILQWLPNFFSRSHHLSATDIGLWFGLAFGMGSIIGTITGALVAPSFIRRDRRWELWLAGICFAVAGPIYLLVFQLPSAQAALAATFVATIVMSTGFAPGLASIQSVARPHVRATAAAVVMFASALIGQGGGPTLVGLLSDLLAASYGQESLRVALSASTTILLWAGIQFWIASKTMREDLDN